MYGLANWRELFVHTTEFRVIPDWNSAHTKEFLQSCQVPGDRLLQRAVGRDHPADQTSAECAARV